MNGQVSVSLDEYWKKLLEASDAAITKASGDTSTDDKAVAESNQFQKGLDQDAASKEHTRSQKLKNCMYFGLAVCLVLFLLSTGIAIAAVAFDALSPEEFHYLSRDQVSTLKSFLGVVLVSGLMADYARKLLK